MAYTPTTWTTGDTITTSKLNKIEQGIAGAGGCFLVGFDTNNLFQLNKTWQEIVDAIKGGKLPILYYENNENDVDSGESTYFCRWSIDAGQYCVSFVKFFGGLDIDAFYTNSSNGYPVLRVDSPVS
jgi:hypothetical protein